MVFYLVIRSSLLLRFYTPAFLQPACLLWVDCSEELCSSSVLAHQIYVLQCLHAIVNTMSIIRKPRRFWYLKSYDTIMNFPVYWTRCLWVILLFTVPEIYHDDTLGAFLWGDLDHDQWSKITHMVHQRNQWIRDQRGFISSIDAPWWILMQLTAKKCTLYRYWTFC